MAKIETKITDIFTSSKNQPPGIYESSPKIKITKTTKFLFILFGVLVCFYVYYFYTKFTYHGPPIPAGYQFSDGSDGPPKLVPIKK